MKAQSTIFIFIIGIATAIVVGTIVLDHQLTTMKETNSTNTTWQTNDIRLFENPVQGTEITADPSREATSLTYEKGNSLSNLTLRDAKPSEVLEDRKYQPECAEICNFPYVIKYGGSLSSDTKNVDFSKKGDFDFSLLKSNPSDDLRLERIEIIKKDNFTFNDVPIYEQVNKTYDIPIGAKIPGKCRELNKTTIECEIYDITGYKNRTIEMFNISTDIKSMEKGKEYVINFVYKRTPSIGKKSTDVVPKIFGFEFPEKDWANSSWIYRKNLTVNASLVNGSHLNFPVLLHVNDSDLATYAQTDGDDIFFTNITDTKLNHEIEFFNKTSGELIAWINLPNLSTNTMIWMYFNNSAATSQQNRNGVWDSNYTGVWHLGNGTTLNGTDSTSKGLNMNNYGASAISGKIDGAAGGVGVLETSATVPTQNDAARTLEIWFKSASDGGSVYHMFSQGFSGSGKSSFSLAYNSASDRLSAYQDATELRYFSWTYDSNWHHLAVSYPGGGINNASMYLDGVAQTTSGSTTLLATNYAYLDIGHSVGDSAHDFNMGGLDEGRMSNIARSVDWINTEFKNQNFSYQFWLNTTKETGESPVTAFNISIENPTNTTYTSASQPVNMSLNFTYNLNSLTIDKIWYRLNATTNVTISGNTTFNAYFGYNNITVGFNSTTGISNYSSTMFFSVAQTATTCWTCSGTKLIIPTGCIFNSSTGNIFKVCT